MSTGRPRQVTDAPSSAAWSDVSGIIRGGPERWRGVMLPGGLQVERVLGRGAVGVVLEATDVASGLRVAVKMLSTESALDQDQRVRLRREARAISRLTSEHVARLHDVRELDDGTPFIVMEYLEGCSLDDVLAGSGPLPVHAAIDYTLQVLDALAEAHALGLVHRDVKPSNVFMVWRKGRGPMVKLLDFGLVKDVIAAPGTIRLTRTGFMLGTPAYMAPEQLAPKSLTDPRSDVWSVAVMLYELLTGHVPFEGSSIPLIVARIMRDEARPLRPIRPDVSPRLDRILARCLAKNPEDRFPSAAALALSLGAEIF